MFALSIKPFAVFQYLLFGKQYDYNTIIVCEALDKSPIAYDGTSLHT